MEKNINEVTEDNLDIVVLNSDDETYDCDMCEETFWQISSLESHISSAHLRSPQQLQTLKCDFCTNSYQDLETLEDHKKAAHNQGRRDYGCSLCGVQFAVKAYLSKHMVRFCYALKDSHDL